MSPVDNYFASLGFQPDKKLIQKNVNMRKWLKNHPKQAKGKHGKSIRGKIATNKKLNNPTDPATGLPVKELDATARAAATQKYGSTRADYNNQVATVDKQIASLDPFFSQYEQHINAVGQDAINTANAQREQIIAQNAQATQQGQAGAQAIAERAGSNPAAQEGLQAQDAAAQGRAALAQTSANAIAERGQIRGDMAKAQAANTGLQKNETRLKLNDNKKKVTDARNVLDQAIGDYFEASKTGQVSQILDNRLKQAALDLQTVKAKNTIADTAHDNAIADKKLSNDENQTSWEKNNVANGLNPNGTPIKTPAAKKPKPKFTQANVNSATQTYKGARDTATAWVKSGKIISQSQINKDVKSGVLKKGQPVPKSNVDHYVAVLAKKMGGTKYNALARAAVMDAIYGGVDAATRKRIKTDFGVTLRLSHSAKSKKK